MIDLTTIPTEALRVELARRGQLQGSTRKFEPCPSCQRPTTARIRRAGCECGQRWPRVGAIKK